MKVTSSEIEGSQVVLDMEIEQERVDKAMERAYRRIASRVNVPGFRKGKAPRVLVERVVGRDTLMSEALEILVPEAYQEAVKETGIDPVDQPKLDVVSAEPLSVRATVPVRPKVQLGDYKAIRQSLEVPEVTEEQVETTMENLRESRAEWTPVDREAAQGDMVTLDMKGRVDVGDKVFVDSQGFQVVVDPERQLVAPGVMEQLVGVKAAEQKSFQVTLPDDFQDKELAGHGATIDISVNEVKEKKLPAVDDEFAKSMGEFSSVDELRTAVRKELEEQARAQAKRSLEESVLAAVVDQATVEPPQPWVEEQAEGVIKGTQKDLASKGLTFEQFLRYSGQTEETFRSEMLSAAKRDLKRMLVLDAVAEDEGITITDEELDDAVEKALAVREGRNDNIDRDRLKSSLRSRLRERRTVDRLFEIASGGESAAEAKADGGE